MSRQRNVRTGRLIDSFDGRTKLPSPDPLTFDGTNISLESDLSDYSGRKM